MARSDGPFEIIERVGNNAYKLQLPGDMAVSATFNVGDMSPYMEDSPSYLRPNRLEEGEVDARAGNYNPQGYPGGPQDKEDQGQGAI